MTIEAGIDRTCHLSSSQENSDLVPGPPVGRAGGASREMMGVKGRGGESNGEGPASWKGRQ